MAARPAASPVSAALERLAKLSSAGTGAARMARETDKIIAEWRDEALDAQTLRERLETLRDDLAGGLTQAEEASGDVDGSDKAAVKQAAATLDGLAAAHATAVSSLAA